jgi:hypothetical protein
MPDFVQVLDALDTSCVGNGFMGFAGSECVLDMMCTCTTENDDVQKRIRTKTVGSVDRNTGGFAGSVEARNDFIIAMLIDCKNLTSVLGRNTAH